MDSVHLFWTMPTTCSDGMASGYLGTPELVDDFIGIPSMSPKKDHRSRIAPETIALVTKLTKGNRLWGAERIHGESLRPNVAVNKRTIQEHMPKVRHRPGQTGATSIKNHAADI
jgi:hypothetical protein